MLFRNRRSELRLEIQTAEAPTCCLLDPLRFAPGIVGRLRSVSKSGAAVELGPEALAALDREHELLVNASLPRSNVRVKRAARVLEVRETADGGAFVALGWVVAEPADRYAHVQQARFDAELYRLLASSAPRGRMQALDIMARLLERGRSDAAKLSR